MKVLETATIFDLPDERVVLAGDWHGNMRWAREAIPAAARTGASTILHVGDFGFWPGNEGAYFLRAVDHWARQVQRPKGAPGIERILVTLGNHEDYDGLDRARDEAGAGPGVAVRVSEVVWALPRPFAFTFGGRRRDRARRRRVHRPRPRRPAEDAASPRSGASAAHRASVHHSPVVLQCLPWRGLAL